MDIYVCIELGLHCEIYLYCREIDSIDLFRSFKYFIIMVRVAATNWATQLSAVKQNIYSPADFLVIIVWRIIPSAYEEKLFMRCQCYWDSNSICIKAKHLEEPKIS